jgi:hypothetical protein
MRSSQPCFAEESFRIELPVDIALPAVALRITAFPACC